jgi:hypothetical protein
MPQEPRGDGRPERGAARPGLELHCERTYWPRDVATWLMDAGLVLRDVLDAATLRNATACHRRHRRCAKTPSGDACSIGMTGWVALSELHALRIDLFLRQRDPTPRRPLALRNKSSQKNRKTWSDKPSGFIFPARWIGCGLVIGILDELDLRRAPLHPKNKDGRTNPFRRSSPPRSNC